VAEELVEHEAVDARRLDEILIGTGVHPADEAAVERLR
jgi:hypothetical protein